MKRSMLAQTGLGYIGQAQLSANSAYSAPPGFAGSAKHSRRRFPMFLECFEPCRKNAETLCTVHAEIRRELSV